MSSYTFYADASDISVRSSSGTFSTARNAASGTTSGGGSTSTYASVGLEGGATYNFYIVFYPFDTSSIPSSETVTAATFSFSLAGDNSGTAANQWAVTQSTQATWNGVAGGDFDQRGTLELATRQNRKVSTETGYQDMVFTETGRGQIARSGETKPASASATGKTQLVMAWAKDLDNSAPATNDYNQVYLSEQTGTTNDPKLAVTASSGYTMVAAQGSYALTGQAVAFLRGLKMAAAQGSYALTGFAALFSKGYGMVSAFGSYAYTGFAAGLSAARLLVAAQGSYALTGQDVTLSVLRKVIVATGYYALTGFAALFSGTFWRNIAKHASTWANSDTKGSSAWENESKS